MIDYYDELEFSCIYSGDKSGLLECIASIVHDEYLARMEFFDVSDDEAKSFLSLAIEEYLLVNTATMYKPELRFLPSMVDHIDWLYEIYRVDDEYFVVPSDEMPYDLEESKYIITEDDWNVVINEYQKLKKL